MSATLVNGRQDRKQLSDQLDRLDRILDGLSDALNEVVADASREGVRQAVKEAVVELLTSADLRTALHQASGSEAAPKPSFWQRLQAKVSRAASKVRAVARSTVATVARRVTAVGSVAARLVRRMRQSRPARTVASWLFGIVAMIVFAKYVVAGRLGAIGAVVQSALVNAVEQVRWGIDRTRYRLGLI